MTMQTAVFLGMGLVVLYALVSLGLALRPSKKSDATKTRAVH
jgi:hypothetical protein